MTDKQIIDGENLDRIKNLLFEGQRDAISTKTFEAIIETLELKEQECEELKDEILYLRKEGNKSCAYCADLIAKEQECERLSEELYYWINGEYCDNECNVVKELDQLKQTLAKIKEIAEDTMDMFYEGLEAGSTYDRVETILQKISECEGNDD